MGENFQLTVFGKAGRKSSGKHYMDSPNQPSDTKDIARFSIWKMLLFSLTTVFLLLVVVEGIWQAACYLEWVDPPARSRDLREEWQWIEMHRDLGPGGFSITAAQYDPELGWKPTPNYKADGIFINSMGQRGTRVVPYERTPDHLRILFIGDSYTFGAQVKDNECFSEVLKTRYLPDAETINLGVSGYGTDQQILFYELEGTKYKADVVVLGFFVHDISRNDGAFRYYAKPEFELADGKLVLSSSCIISPTELLRLYNSGERAIRPQGFCISEALLKSIDQSGRRHIDESSYAWKISAKLLERFQEKVLQDGAHPLLLIIPNEEILTEKESRSDHITKLLRDKADEIGLDYLDMGPILRDQHQKDPAIPLYDGHWTIRGHEVAAESLFRTFEKLGWLQSRLEDQHPQG